MIITLFIHSCPGKHGYLQLGFELDADGKSILRHLDRRAPLIVQQELYFDATLPQMPCVYILSSGGPNVDGDRYRQDISVGKDAMAWISTGAATKLASMKYNYSGMVQHITLDQGAYLEYLPEPIIPHARTRYISDRRYLRILPRCGTVCRIPSQTRRCVRRRRCRTPVFRQDTRV